MPCWNFDLFARSHFDLAMENTPGKGGVWIFIQLPSGKKAGMETTSGFCQPSESPANPPHWPTGKCRGPRKKNFRKLFESLPARRKGEPSSFSEFAEHIEGDVHGQILD